MGTSADPLRFFSAQADSLTYEPFFELREKPFSLLNTDPRFLYHSPSHAAAFEGLLGGIRRREGLLVLTGEIGTGKTTLCRAVLRSLGRTTFSSFVPDPFASREDLLKMLLIDFGVISIQDLTTGPLKQASRAELSYLLSGFLESLDPLDAFVVVIIDEAQNLSLPLIEETRILADTFGAQGRLQIVFVGQLELLPKLQSPEMRQVDQRVCGYHRLAPMGLDAVGGYVQHRLRVAGGPHALGLFAPEVLDTLHRRSGGVPRLVNRICDRALHLAHQRHAPIVNLDILEAALIDVGATTLAPTWASVMFPEPAPAARPAATPVTPLQEAPTPAPVVAAPAALATDDGFSKRVDEWLTQELPSSRTLTSLPVARAASPDSPARAAAPTTMVRRESRSKTAPPGRKANARSTIAPPRLARLWTRPLSIAAVAIAALGAAGVGATYVRAEVSSMLTTPAWLPALPAPPALDIGRVEPPAPPPAEPLQQAVSGGEYLISVGLFASRAHADRLVDELTQAGLPASQRPFQLRTRQVQQVVLGPFSSHPDAVADLQRLRALGGFDDANVLGAPLAATAP
ncbi:MAG: AAA family ATPase [Vicinamibacterales bacterium]|nr:AAA family ATPase [Vicinamibacterales bacterium]